MKHLLDSLKLLGLLYIWLSVDNLIAFVIAFTLWSIACVEYICNHILED